jgi:Flp pilus assembly protein TadD
MNRAASRLLLLLVLSGAYLYAWPSPTLFYIAAELLHVALGVVTAVLLAPLLKRRWSGLSRQERAGWTLVVLGTLLGLLLILLGTPRSRLPWLYAHIGLMLAGTSLLLAGWVARRRWLSASVALASVALVAVAFSAGAYYLRVTPWQSGYKIQNPEMPPASMEGEGDGSTGPFFPSSARTTDGKKIPPEFFMKSDACQRCHADIYQQWFSSAHHFSSFNNQWYRKSIEYMQDVVGTRPSKWCGGCHDPAVLFSGLMDTPIKQIINRPEAHAGMGCMMCHSMVRVNSSMGQGDYVVEYPKLHELAASENPLMRTLHDFAVRLNPEPHRRAFLKPFMRQQTAEFCSTCHKVHLDVPVNHYRWIRGFNEYDNWQASGVSGQGARSFYYPPKPQKCADCHMPLVDSHDDANVDGKVHSHRFPGANTALPFANQDSTQLQVVEKFLKDKNVTVDIFALAPAHAKTQEGMEPQHEMSTEFAVGEEAEVATPGSAAGEAVPVIAPLNRVQPALRQGENARLDVVVRTRKVGHFFPGGTVDAFDVWLELYAVDDRGKVVFHSGKVEDDGRGPVEKGAHFYRSLMVDAHGNPINKRNAWATRSLVYVRLIPPGAADTVHYRVRIPEDAGDRVTFKARLRYRKFSWFNTHFSYAGIPDPQQKDAAHSADYDDRTLVFTGDTSKVSGKLKYVPDLPILTLAEDEVTLPVAPRGAPAEPPRAVLDAKDWERWNDYGIGLLLQGDLKGAEAAFQKATEVSPANADGWVNIGRARVQEGDTRGARVVLEKALALKPELARTHFFYAKALREDGEYDRAIEHLRLVLAQYPRDRVALNELGRTLFLQRKYDEAVQPLEAVLAIDPEDLQAHYNLMLCYNGLGDAPKAEEHQKRYLRFKADESAQAITGAYRLSHPEDNNERQAIHEHESVRLGPTARSVPQSSKIALKHPGMTR